MKYTKKLIRTSGGLVVRVPADIVKVLGLTEKDYVEIDISKIDVRALNRTDENQRFSRPRKS